MTHSEKHTYFMTDVGHPHAQMAPPADDAERRTWRKWLGVVLAAIGLSVAVVIMLAGINVTNPLEATVQMERLARKIERTRSIDSETARYITQVFNQPQYDCSQIGCSASLLERNRAVRDRLKIMIAQKTPSSNFAGATQDSDAVTTGSTNAERQK